MSVRRCPICRRTVPPAGEEPGAARTMPFCSERCRTIDLARWLDERYRSPADADDGDGAGQDGLLEGGDDLGLQ